MPTAQRPRACWTVVQNIRITSASGASAKCPAHWSLRYLITFGSPCVSPVFFGNANYHRSGHKSPEVPIEASRSSRFFINLPITKNDGILSIASKYTFAHKLNILPRAFTFKMNSNNNLKASFLKTKFLTDGWIFHGRVFSYPILD